MNNWIEVRVRGCVNGHEIDRTATGIGAVVHVITKEEKDEIEGELAILGEWSVARMAMHLKRLAEGFGNDRFMMALMLQMMHGVGDDVVKDLSDEAKAEAAANAAAEEMELASEEIARRAVAEGCCVKEPAEELNGVEGDGEEPVTPIE